MPRKQKQEVSQTKENRRTKLQTTPETPFDETPSAAMPVGEKEADVRSEETVGTSAEVEQTANETTVAKPAGDPETSVRAEETIRASVEGGEMPGGTATDDATGKPAAASTEQPPTGDKIGQPEVDTATTLAMRRWRERPTCCCGCGQSLSSAKKNFVQGHDGKAKVIVRKIMRGELLAGDAPAELILRHAEIKFIMSSPEFGRVVEAWRKICGLAGVAAGK